MDKITNNRLKRYRLKLLPYTFKIEYVPGSKLYIANLLSRNIIQRPSSDDSDMTEVEHTVQIIPELSYVR